ncbi:MAG: hypothetical protein HY747_12400 [Elusimicrobia bacterium]|nr:hypothetical protein [Elusimicrobiota bacterium]
MSTGGRLEPLVLESRIKIPYSWAAGETGSRFLIALRDQQKIMATRCPACHRVYCPPKKNCGDCFELCGEWLEVGPQGKLVSFTQALYSSPVHPLERPIYADNYPQVQKIEGEGYTPHPALSPLRGAREKDVGNKPIYGLIKLEGADTAILHLISEARIEELKAGLIVEPVFRQERKGHILDIAYFRVSK